MLGTMPLAGGTMLNKTDRRELPAWSSCARRGDSQQAHTRSSGVKIAESEEVEPGWGKRDQKSLSQEVTFELRPEL